ncbi:hypothetical protein [Acidianus bottle-shaped virus 3 strain ABV3]|uniref:Uncharacterized protein n=1 Tax=Acidianus bottle-shaped virus 3 strain ABV3 TaxID=1732174 RepID=A0A0N9NI68_9VIRU|nr:hypothetical protein AVU00_gp16 [Acidianus bottle-shaped virus 3 strain ABV3]ALG96818.1 hypothetical protein [Acidianus bottle-shaped virus 3 strain ABV3]
MPSGNALLPQDLMNKLGAFEKFLPKEVKNNLIAIKNAKRTFSIPVKTEQGYLVIAGILLDQPVPSQLLFDEEDLKLILEAVKKAYQKLGLDPYEELCRIADTSEQV